MRLCNYFEFVVTNSITLLSSIARYYSIRNNLMTVPTNHSAGDQLKRLFVLPCNCLFLNCVFVLIFFFVFRQKTRSERMRFNQSGLHLFFSCFQERRKTQKKKIKIRDPNYRWCLKNATKTKTDRANNLTGFCCCGVFLFCIRRLLMACAHWFQLHSASWNWLLI